MKIYRVILWEGCEKCAQILRRGGKIGAQRQNRRVGQKSNFVSIYRWEGGRGENISRFVPDGGGVKINHSNERGAKNSSWHEGDQNIWRFGENYSPPYNIKKYHPLSSYFRPGSRLGKNKRFSETGFVIHLRRIFVVPVCIRNRS